MAIVGALVIVGFSFTNPPAAPSPRTSSLPSPQKPLWKPEPVLLLTRADLELTASQRTAIEKISKEWEVEKRHMLDAMQGTEPTQGRLDQIQSQLGDYSRLSEQYNIARSARWSEAAQLLTPRQLKLVTP